MLGFHEMADGQQHDEREQRNEQHRFGRNNQRETAEKTAAIAVLLSLTAL